ncbi:hypothetical protein CAPTEDRAFT_217870 [Capitella teleta]|uniref:Polysaccharide pyruvyl transferase domain-containing protein n=1 Tax=Capitella teleta TaxID=283909 RepID=R7VKW6_CAPTE|nr:hypothetical protein CAPTEDRAFT_217870 [Capitella teleta]|eukprot:ELU17726.1 hypothetical protein CAPTEDRAFT_217870 [Capitella teleta]
MELQVYSTARILIVLCLLYKLCGHHEDKVTWSEMVDSECGDFPLEPNSRQTWSKCWSDHFRAIPNAKSVSGGMQTMLLKVLAQLLNDIDKVILLDIPVFENKGDPAIALGEFNLMRMLHKEVIYTCTYQCGSKQWQRARDMVDTLGSGNVAVLAHGGGNVGGYPERDLKRYEMMEMFPDVKFIMMPQSVFFNDSVQLRKAAKMYAKHKDLIILLRNQPSFEVIHKAMPLVTSILAPDAAYGIGRLTRFMEPLYDFIIMRRGDEEAVSDIGSFHFPDNVTFAEGDWNRLWPTPRGKTLLDQLHLFPYNGMLCIQRGRVLITDRLHGHIVSTLFDNLPTVILGNSHGKLRDFYDTWSSPHRTVIAHTAEEASIKAVDMLRRFYPDRVSNKEDFQHSLTQCTVPNCGRNLILIKGVMHDYDADLFLAITI